MHQALVITIHFFYEWIVPSKHAKETNNWMFLETFVPILRLFTENKIYLFYFYGTYNIFDQRNTGGSLR